MDQRDGRSLVGAEGHEDARFAMQLIVAEQRAAVLAMVGPVRIATALALLATEQGGHPRQTTPYRRRQFGDEEHKRARFGALPAAFDQRFMSGGQGEGCNSRGLAAALARRAAVCDIETG